MSGCGHVQVGVSTFKPFLAPNQLTFIFYFLSYFSDGLALLSAMRNWETKLSTQISEVTCGRGYLYMWAWLNDY